MRTSIKIIEVRLGEGNYPELLNKISSPPQKLFIKSKLNTTDLSLLFKNCLGVVGSRNMTSYGKRAIRSIFSDLVKSKITIVSGFMHGVDIEAHKNALKFGLKTIAVMPCGINFVHPSDYEKDYNEVLASGGAIISEYSDKVPPKKYSYVKRNRIIAGLSKAVLAVESSLRSGTLITATLANDYNRKLFTIPGSIFSNVFQGNYQLYKNGAEFIISGADINTFFGLSSAGKNILSGKVSVDSKVLDAITNKPDLERKILKTLFNEPMTIDDLSRLFKKPVGELLSKLTMMAIEGLITEERGKFYAN